MSTPETNVPPPQQMFQMITGYWVSQIVGTVAELGVADRLACGPKTAAELATEVGANPDALHRLLRACASVGVMTATSQAGGTAFALTPLGETLRSIVPGSMRDFARAQTSTGHWLPWGRLGDAVRSGTRQAPAALGREIFEHYAQSPAEAAAFSGAMNNLAMLAAAEVVRVVDAAFVGGATRAVDVGGAHGTLIAAMLDAYPHLHGVLLDLPHVVESARSVMAARGLAQRCELTAGDFFQSVPPADIYLLKQILHDWTDEQCKTILGHVAAGLRAGGRALVVEMVIPDDGRPTPAQLMDLNMLVLVPGRERTASEYAALATASGLRVETIHETHSPFQIIELRGV